MGDSTMKNNLKCKSVFWSVFLSSLLFAGFAGCSDDSVSRTNDDTNSQQCDCETGDNCSEAELEDCKKDDACPSECPNDCTDGKCNEKDKCPESCPGDCSEDGKCNEKDKCPESCPGDCSEDGECNPKSKCPEACPNSCGDDGECHEVTCPEDCQNGCDSDGVCKTDADCPASCPGNCTDGECNTGSNCPEDCPDTCDEEGKCPTSACPEECLENCNEDLTCPDPCPKECPGNCDDELKCPDKCPEACPGSCDEEGKCKCPETCTTSCDDDGICKCPDTCKTRCDVNGVCQCPDTCTTNCDANGVCQCPSTCTTNCDDNGACQCPSTCKTNCDANGVCQCPAACTTKCDANGVCQCPDSCKNTCNANGECPVMCGKEVVKSMYFSYKELDILVPDSSGRTSADMTVYIKTEKETYNMETAPCKADIVLTMDDKTIATVTKNSKKPKNATFKAVKAGKTKCTISLKGQKGITGSIVVRVLNLNKIDANLAAKNDDGKYPHIYKKPMAMVSTTRVSQGFDFYNDNFMYFTQLPKVKIDGKDAATKDGKTKYDRTQMNIFQNDGSKNSKRMIFHASGHGQNLSVENVSGKDYLWFANYGYLICDDANKNCGDGYKRSQIISRVEWKEDTSMYPTDSKENYYYSDKTKKSYYHSFEPALDTKNNKFAFRAYYVGNKKTYVRIYHLNQVKAIAASKVKLPMGIIWINKNNELKTGYKPEVEVRDLSKIDALNEWSVASLPVQGLEIENGIAYTVTGLPKKLAKAEGKNGKYLYKSEIPLTIYSYGGTSLGGPNKKTISNKNGNEYVYYLNTSKGPKEEIKYKENNNDNGKTLTYSGYFLNNAELDGMVNFTENGKKFEHNGYFEPEGIRVSDGKIYLSVTARYNVDGESNKAARQVIFVYKLY